MPLSKNTDKNTHVVYQVSEIVQELRQLLEASYRNVWVEAELSSLSRPASGHWYFTLKDDSAQIRCAMFKGAVSQSFSRTSYTPQEGDLVKVRGKISVYPQRGDMQFIAQHMQPSGEGALRKQFELLKEKLSKEGLFDTHLKRALPIMPNCIGLVTSPTGAAIHDILSTLKRRFPSIPVRIYPSAVQGDIAAANLISAIELAEQDKHCDVLIISRGGGSLEDLWSFNDEQLARKVRACSITTISAVGHEVDVSICDYAADVRAATPTAAAEIVAPDQSEYVRQLTSLKGYLANLSLKSMQNRMQSVDWLSQRLVDPRKKLNDQKVLLSTLEKRIKVLINNKKDQTKINLNLLTQRINTQHPKQLLLNTRQNIQQISQALIHANNKQLKNKQDQLTYITRHLNAVSPLETLDRGYSITATDNSLKQVVRDSGQIKSGDKVFIKLAKGGLECSVDSTLKHTRDSVIDEAKSHKD